MGRRCNRLLKTKFVIDLFSHVQGRTLTYLIKQLGLTAGNNKSVDEKNYFLALKKVLVGTIH